MLVQTAVDRMRLQLGEPVEANSRWSDAQLLAYLNQGRRKFAKDTEAIKNQFSQTTTVGATSDGEDRYARYPLDTKVWKIDSVLWDDCELDAIDIHGGSDVSGIRESDTQGFCRFYRRIGQTIDLIPCPHSAEILDVFCSIIPDDVLIGDEEQDLNDDQVQGAVDYGCKLALDDDDRDSSVYAEKYAMAVREWKKALAKKGPRFVNILEDDE